MSTCPSYPSLIPWSGPYRSGWAGQQSGHVACGVACASQLVQREYHACCLCTTQAFVFLNGSKIGFFRGDIKLLLDDIKELKPTLFAVVPRLLNRIYDKVSPAPSCSRRPAPCPTWCECPR